MSLVSQPDLESSRMRTYLAPAQEELSATPVYLVRATVYNASSQGLSRDMSFFHQSLRVVCRDSIWQIFSRRLNATKFLIV